MMHPGKRRWMRKDQMIQESLIGRNNDQIQALIWYGSKGQDLLLKRARPYLSMPGHPSDAFFPIQ
nr:hypothetical protein Q903MT_gene5996 [Picea sitchensis]